VEDVLAAANYLIARPNVDATRLYLAGHSVGGTLVMLTAMTTDRFRAAASFSGSPDQIAWSKGQESLVPFDTGDIHEFQMRSPIAFATSFKCPVRIYYGSREKSARCRIYRPRRGYDSGNPRRLSSRRAAPKRPIPICTARLTIRPQRAVSLSLHTRSAIKPRDSRLRNRRER
jgi:hypothetical protein